jgi:hypothetical protein
VLEDEGHMIGANHLPECLRIRMAQSPLAVVEDPFDVRLERLRESISIACIATLSPRMAKGWQAYGSICITACLPSAVAWGCSVLPSSLNASMRRWRSSSAPPAPRRTSPGWCRYWKNGTVNIAILIFYRQRFSAL